jgi:cell division septal protein FtsQ
MTSQPKESRRAERRAARQQREAGPQREPALLRTPASGADTMRAPAPQVNERGWSISWRLFSGLIAVSLIVVLVIFLSSDAFFVRTIGVNGAETMTPNEVFALADVAGLHVFWVDPAKVRENLMRSPSLADAQVTTGWGSPLVTVSVQERQPALIWDQAGVQVWVDVAGRVMRLRDDTRELLRVVVDDVSLGPAAGEVDQTAVNSALQLSALLPDVSTLRFHPTNGLGFTDPRGWDVWMGVGDNMEQRVQVYEALIGDLQDRGVTPRSIYLINANRPWYSTT